ncbi:DUF4861 domain-containing protein [Pedobacter alpinus]|uniref:DUF4861 domain-containing protein n=1 Tax=Pedobacter alpinus TaxID=1590643 RepID=A0ABW5TVX4_9SPHI
MKFPKNIASIAFICLLINATFISCSSIKNLDQPITVTVENSSKLNKTAETIEIDWKRLSKLKDLNFNEIIVKEESSGKEIPSQIIYNGEKNPQSIIFQTNINAQSSQKFLITKGTPAKYETKVYGRQVPERFDDFAWENDKVAFRMYGEALEGKAGMAKGIDFWAKRTSGLVINKWYKSDNYHKDNGEGVDAYHVGITLGAGNASPIVGNEIIYPINYSEYEILDNGPIRFSFKLSYKPYLVNGKNVTETKTISLDAGSQLNKVVNNYVTDGALQIAAGVTKHKNNGVKKMDKAANYVAYWDQADGGTVNGFMGVGVVYPLSNVKETKESDQHVFMVVEPDKNKNVSYYQGGGWSKSGNFEKPEAWFSYLENFSENLKNPLTVKVD